MGETALHAVALGRTYEHTPDGTDLMFFLSTELLTNPQVGAVLGFTIFSMVLFTLSFWDSSDDQEALVVVAIQIIAFFAINPFLIALPDWRNTIIEEAEGLLHFSVGMNLALKSGVTLLLLLLITSLAFGCLNLCIGSLGGVETWVSMLFDSASLTLPFICFGLYSLLPLQIVQIVASLPFLFMIFFSTTFSPGAGVEVIREFRFLFARFYWWCNLSTVKGSMEGCPADDQLIWWTIFTGCLGLILFLVFQMVRVCVSKCRAAGDEKKRNAVADRPEFSAMQTLLFKNSPSMTSYVSKSSNAANDFRVDAV